MDFEKLATRIAGEITMAENPGVVIRKWRDIFNVSQKDLSRKLEVSPSVI
ncbi:MAG TPA: transcriptional regulator, partial [archaeon]|nr:transcriptional regulator [archaeon]